MSADSSGHKLLEPLTEEQQLIVDEICNVFFDKDSTWPKFQYVQAHLDHKGLDLRTILGTFPTVGDQYIRYGALAQFPNLLSANENFDICVTLLGLWHCQSRPEFPRRVAAEVLRALEVFSEYRSSWKPNPTLVENCQIDSEALISQLSIDRQFTSQFMSTEDFARMLFQIMKNEPPFSTGYGARGETYTKWTWNVDRSVLRYSGVRTIVDYLSCIEKVYASPQLFPQRVLVSPLDLPTSLGYLNTAWRLFHERRPLLNLSSPEKIASLAFDVATREEFYDRVSALCDVIKSFIVPKGGDQNGGHALEKMGPYLKSILPEEAHQRALEAIEALSHIRTIRNGGEHGDAHDQAASSFRALGVSLPVTDWSNTWVTIRGRAIVAFDNLREELLSAADTHDQ